MSIIHEDRISKSIRRLQKDVAVKVDGDWGNASQGALVLSQKKLALDWVSLRTHFGILSQGQVDGFNEVLHALNAYSNTDAIKPSFAAYLLATTWHETASTMKPIAEYGKGAGRKYGKWYTNSKGDKYGLANSRGDAYLYSKYPHLYYGRGYVQLTWWDNYKLLGDLLKVDLVNKPELSMVPRNAANIFIEGSLKGLFTGKSLRSYIGTGSFTEFTNARRVINGTDKATYIAKHTANFMDCLILS